MYIFTLLSELLKLVAQEFVKWVTPFVSELFKISYMGFTLTFVREAVLYSCVLGTVLLALKILSDLTQTYALGLGDYDHSPVIVIRRAVVALVAIWASPQCVWILISITSTMSNDVLSLFGSTGSQIDDVLNTVNQSWLVDANAGSIFFNALMSIAVVLIFLMVVYQMLKRGVELVLMQIVGPIFAVSFASNDPQNSSLWFRHLIALTMGQCLQIFMIRALIYLLCTSASTLSDILNIPITFINVFAFVWAVFTVTIPSFLQKFSHTGGGNSRGGQIAMQASLQAFRSGMQALKTLK